jgi:hypothetical protein
VESVFALPWIRRSLWRGLAVRFAWNTQAKEPMSKDTMKKGKTKHNKMKKDSGATGMKPEASGTMGQ